MCLFMLADSEEGWIFQKVESTKKVQGFFLALLQIEKKVVCWAMVCCFLVTH